MGLPLEPRGLAGPEKEPLHGGCSSTLAGPEKSFGAVALLSIVTYEIYLHEKGTLSREM